MFFFLLFLRTALDEAHVVYFPQCALSPASSLFLLVGMVNQSQSLLPSGFLWLAANQTRDSNKIFWNNVDKTNI